MIITLFNDDFLGSEWNVIFNVLYLWGHLSIENYSFLRPFLVLLASNKPKMAYSRDAFNRDERKTGERLQWA